MTSVFACVVTFYEWLSSLDYTLQQQVSNVLVKEGEKNAGTTFQSNSMCLPLLDMESV